MKKCGFMDLNLLNIKNKVCHVLDVKDGQQIQTQQKWRTT